MEFSAFVTVTVGGGVGISLVTSGLFSLGKKGLSRMLEGEGERSGSGGGG